MATRYIGLEDLGPSKPWELVNPVVPAGTITRNAAGQLVPYAAAAQEASQAPAPSMAAVAAQPQAQAPVAAPIATPDTRPAPTTDQGMNWAKAAQSAVKGFGITPKGQEIQSMEERGLVKDSQGRWVPSEALQQAVEANYQAGIAARNPSVQAPVATKSDTAGVITIKRPAISAFDMSFVGKADMSNPSFRNAMVAKEEYARESAAMESDRRAAEKQQELGLREGALGIQRDELGFRKYAENAKRGLQEKELGLRMAEAPAMRELREAQTQQALADAAYRKEQARLYPETINQSKKAAEAKAQGASLSKIQSNIFKLETELRQAITPEQKAAAQKAINNQRLQYEALLK